MNCCPVDHDCGLINSSLERHLKKWSSRGTFSTLEQPAQGRKRHFPTLVWIFLGLVYSVKFNHVSCVSFVTCSYLYIMCEDFGLLSLTFCLASSIWLWDLWGQGQCPIHLWLSAHCRLNNHELNKWMSITIFGGYLVDISMHRVKFWCLFLFYGLHSIRLFKNFFYGSFPTQTKVRRIA